MKFYQKVWRKMNRKGYGKNKRVGKLTRHHNKARSLGGTYAENNIFMLSTKHHQAYHALFGLRTFDEAIQVLRRLQEQHQERLFGGERNENTVLHPRTLQGVWETDTSQSNPRKTHRVIRESHLEDLQ